MILHTSTPISCPPETGLAASMNDGDYNDLVAIDSINNPVRIGLHRYKLMVRSAVGYVSGLVAIF